MQRSLSTLTAIALGLALAGPAAAQDASPQEGAAPDAAAPPAQPAAPEEPEAEAPAAPEDATVPDQGEVAQEPAPAEAAPEEPAGPAPQAPIAEQQEDADIRDTFGDWDIRCVPGTDECLLHQIGQDDDGNPVIEFNLRRLPEGAEAAALVNILTPLGTFLPAGISVQVDDRNARQYGFTFCAEIGCIAQLALTEETVAAMQRGRAATVSLASISAPEQPVGVELSLMGFTDAWNAVTPVQADPAPAPTLAPAAPAPAPLLAPAD